MAWITDSLRSAIAAVPSLFGRSPQQDIASAHFAPQLAIAAYMASGMLRKVIDIPAADRTREWRDWQAESDQIDALEKVEKELGLLAKVKQAEVLRGLGGGALILALPGDLAQPAPENAKLIAVNVVSRWQLSLQDIDENMASPTYGEPRMFRINGGSSTQQDIHPSRVIAFRGEPVPMGLGVSAEEAFWGSSRLSRVVAEVQKSDNAALWFAELVKKAKLLRIGIPDLANMVATPGGQEKLNARVATIALGENIMNATLFSAAASKDGAGETITDYQVSWAGIPAVQDMFDQRVAAVADIPFTRLMGRSPAGMNATGEHDTANWSATIAAGQELELRPCLERLDPHLFATAGVDPADIWWKFSPLWKPTAKETADTFKTTAEAIKLISDVNAMPQEAFNAGVQSVIEANGWMPGAIPILADMSEEERFGIEPNDDGTDPSALTQSETPNGGKEADPTSPTTAGGEEAPPRRLAANDKATLPEDVVTV